MTTPRRPVAPGPVIQGDPAAIVGRPWTQAIFWVVVLAASAVDIATFYQVLVVVLNAPDWLVWSVVVGFVAVVLTLAHQAGVNIRRAVHPRHIVAARTLAWVFGGVWLFLGLVAFTVRFFISQPLSSDASTFTGDAASQSFDNADLTSQHVTAFLFLAFYLATGVITGLVGGYARPDPSAKQYGMAMDQWSTAMKRHANTKRRFGRVIKLGEQVDEAEARSKEAFATAQQEAQALADRLKHEIRLRLAALATTAPLPDPTTGSRPGSGWPDHQANGHPPDLAGPPTPAGTDDPQQPDNEEPQP